MVPVTGGLLQFALAVNCQDTIFQTDFNLFLLKAGLEAGQFSLHDYLVLGFKDIAVRRPPSQRRLPYPLIQRSEPCSCSHFSTSLMLLDKPIVRTSVIRSPTTAERVQAGSP